MPAWFAGTCRDFLESCEERWDEDPSYAAAASSIRKDVVAGLRVIDLGLFKEPRAGPGPTELPEGFSLERWEAGQQALEQLAAQAALAARVPRLLGGRQE